MIQVVELSLIKEYGLIIPAGMVVITQIVELCLVEDNARGLPVRR